MPDEKLLIYVVAAAMLLLKLLADVLQRWRVSRMAQQARHETLAHDSPAQRWDSLHDTRADEAQFEASSPRLAAKTSASHSTARSETQLAVRRQRPVVRVEAATRHRLALGDRAELRRAVQLMTILGPPRSRVPDDR